LVPGLDAHQHESVLALLRKMVKFRSMYVVADLPDDFKALAVLFIELVELTCVRLDTLGCSSDEHGEQFRAGSGLTVVRINVCRIDALHVGNGIKDTFGDVHIWISRL